MPIGLLQRAFRGPLDHRAVRHRIGKRHAEFDHVRSGFGQRNSNCSVVAKSGSPAVMYGMKALRPSDFNCWNCCVMRLDIMKFGEPCQRIDRRAGGLPRIELSQIRIHPPHRRSIHLHFLKTNCPSFSFRLCCPCTPHARFSWRCRLRSTTNHRISSSGSTVWPHTSLSAPVVIQPFIKLM